MRALIAAILLAVSSVAAAEIPEPRYGGTYSASQTLDMANGCSQAAFKVPVAGATQEQKLFCICMTWWIANSVSSYEFEAMSAVEAKPLIQFASGKCIKALEKKKPARNSY